MRCIKVLLQSSLIAAAVTSLLGGGVHADAAPSCQFASGFASLAQQIPQTVATCLAQPSINAKGDWSQATSAGLLVWRRADNWTGFTDGSRTWVAGPYGLQVRNNDEIFEWEPIPAAPDPDPNAPPPAVVEDPLVPGPVASASPTEVSVGSLVNVMQTLNNCGPSSIVEVLRYYGVWANQATLRTMLRPPSASYGMDEKKFAPYAGSIGMKAYVSRGGSDALLKALVKNGLPVIVEQGINDDYPALHYRPIEGYDDGLGQFISSDPLLGPRHAMPYADFNNLWAETNGWFAVIYPASKQGALNAALQAAGQS